MIGTRILLNAYYEALHERLTTGKKLLAARIENLLHETVRRDFPGLDKEKYAAYKDACLAFVDERLETYNPIGVQYTFDENRRRQAAKLELQLDWYDSRAEFETLVETAQAKAESETELTDERIAALADELIKELGAFPNNSILAAYHNSPALGKLPDYIVARAIRELIT